MSRPVEELIRLAMLYAEQDRRSFAEANGSNQVAAEANELAEAFRAYRIKRWGRTTMEAQLDSATLVSIDELRRRASPETASAPEPPEKKWECSICDGMNYVTSTHCEHCQYSRMVMQDGRQVPRDGQR